MSIKYEHRILFVDDEVSITKSLMRLFRKDSYVLESANSGQEAINILLTKKKPFSLIISDQRMPGMSGAEFLEKSREIFPNTIRFLLTGYSDMSAVIEAVNKGEIHRYLTKPWDDQDLIVQVHQALKQYEMILENIRLQMLTKKQNDQLNAFNKQLETKVLEKTKEIVQQNKTLNRINKELESNLFDTVRAFASLLDMTIPALKGHGQRVSVLSREVAYSMKLDEKESTTIEIAALLHDLGKLSLPHKLNDLNQEKWTAEDRKLFESHPVAGRNIVHLISRLDYVGLLIQAHHEKFDGTGYPDHLSEETIPVGARIISVTDTYDKIVNLRVNSKHYLTEYIKNQGSTQDHVSPEELLEKAAIFHLKHYAFTWYDPEVVKCFLEVRKTSGLKIKNDSVIDIDDLKPGMVLSRPIYTKNGRFLLPYKHVLDERLISKLKQIFVNEPFDVAVYIPEPTDLKGRDK